MSHDHHSILDLQQADELLSRAIKSISDGRRRYNFSSWCQCACGHLYRGATGKQETIRTEKVYHPSNTGGDYERLMKVIASFTNMPRESAAFSISDYVAKFGTYREDGARALEHIRTLIRHELSIRAEAAEKITITPIPQGMDIGDPMAPLHIEPTKSPVPERREEPARRPERHEPSSPETTPEPVRVPERAA